MKKLLMIAVYFISTLSYASDIKIKYSIPSDYCISYLGSIKDTSKLTDAYVGCGLSYQIKNIATNKEGSMKEIFLRDDVGYNRFWGQWFSGEGAAISLFLGFPVVAMMFAPLAHIIDKQDELNACEEAYELMSEETCEDAIIDDGPTREIIID